MKMCQKHWDELKDAIKSRGLYEFVAKSGQAVTEQMVAELEGTTDDSRPYDPLMSANCGIIMHAAEIEPSLMFSDCCPLCEVDKAAGKGSAQNWINGCTDEILNDFRSHEWVAMPN